MTNKYLSHDASVGLFFAFFDIVDDDNLTISVVHVLFNALQIDDFPHTLRLSDLEQIKTKIKFPFKREVLHGHSSWSINKTLFYQCMQGINIIIACGSNIIAIIQCINIYLLSTTRQR